MDERDSAPATSRSNADRRPLTAGIGVLLVLAMLALAIVGWFAANAHGALSPTNPTPPSSPAARSVQPGAEPGAERLRVEVLEAVPHDRDAFTQGLLWHDGTLYESTGLHGRSSLRQVDPTTGEVRRQVRVDPMFFAEGLARVGNRLIQITWQQGVALVYDIQTFDLVTQFRYGGEGWGLCFDGERLVMTDGSSNLTMRDPQTFAEIATVAVTLDGRPLTQLNELECVGDRVYANVWMTDMIVRIDPRSGRVEAVIDAANLLSPDERRQSDVLNGIAYDPERDVFLITGKLWPRLFTVRFVPPPAS
jgi:glutamine cyclotransferase